jgi:hypothetical protein
VLSLCVGGIIAVVVGVIVSLFVSRDFLLASDFYRDGIARATAHPEVVELTGTPLRTAFIPERKVNKPVGHLALTLGVMGPRGSGKLVMLANEEGRA